MHTNSKYYKEKNFITEAAGFTSIRVKNFMKKHIFNGGGVILGTLD